MRIANVAAGNGRPDWSKVHAWVEGQRPDVVTLQKIGSKDAFPTAKFHRLGYTCKLLGRRDRSDLGVAILSRSNLPAPVIVAAPKQDVESRFLSVRIGQLWVSSVYAPLNPKGESHTKAIARRVDWLHGLRAHVEDQGHAQRDSLLCGDFNVMADGPPWKGGYSRREWRVLQELLSLGFCDLYRRAHPCVTENRGWTRGYKADNTKGSNRLHLILASKSLASRLQSAHVAIESKPWPRKDAPPLVVDLDGVEM